MSSKKTNTVPETTGDKSSDELTAVVEELLNSLSSKFNGVSSEIFAKMDEMSKRLDNLEAAMQANKDNTPGSPSKSS
ncbi:heat shock factor-binding protein [Xylariaceae sp. FL1272]|nr:heat shock factor-binding protein [Xylariaceae sp. FL1272]